MPGFNNTGPEGKGPKTGRGLGDCDDKRIFQSKPDQNKMSWMEFFLRILIFIKGYN